MAPTTIGPYRIVRLIGEGGMGSVYEARQEPLDRRVALKTLHPEYASNKDAVARFFTEAKVLSKLEHPSIVQVSDFGNAADGTSYLVMEYLRGESFAHRLKGLADRGERLPAATALQAAWQVADALAIAHAQGIVHRDLKPANLMLVADPVAPGGERVKILDFGIAKLTKAKDLSSVKTDTQVVLGTPQYMSPEQCAGAGGVDAKTDVYSLGCILYEALAGRPPFVAEGAGQLVGMHLFREPPALGSFAPKVQPKIIELVHLLLTKDKEKRPSMSEACDEMGLILSKLTVGGTLIRSRLPATTDPDSTRMVPQPRVGTTLGQSSGQLGRSLRQRWRWVVLSAAGLSILAALLLLRSHSFLGPQGAQGTQPAPTQQPVELPAAAGIDAAPSLPATTSTPPIRHVPAASSPSGAAVPSALLPVPTSPPPKSAIPKPVTPKPLNPSKAPQIAPRPPLPKKNDIGYTD